MSKAHLWNYAPLKQHEVASMNNDGGTECGVLLEDDNVDPNTELSFRCHKKEGYRKNKRCCRWRFLKSFTRLEKILLLISLVLSIIVIISLLKIGTFSKDSEPPSTATMSVQQNSNLCLTRGCIQTANRVAQSLDESVDPCEDFYQFSCGGWKSKNPLPSGYSRWTTFNILWRQNQATLKSLLESNTSSTEPSETKAKRLYNACNDLEAIEKVGIKPLIDLINKVGGWEVLGTWNESEFDFNSSMKVFSNYSHFPFFSFGVGTDSKHSNSNVIQVGSEYLSAGSRQYYLNKTVTEDRYLSTYLDYMTTVATLLGGAANFSRGRMLDVLNLEKQLAVILPPLVELRDDKKNYNRMPLSSLKNLAPAIDWLDLIPSVFRSFANMSIPDDEPVIVQSLNYIKDFSGIVYSTKKSTLHNFMMWQFVRSFVGNLGEKFRDAVAEVGKVKSGANWNCIERWRSCASEVDGVLGKQLGKMFVERRFNSDSKKTAEKIVSAIKSSFQSNLDSLTWMDSATKEKASKKVNAVADLIGFSDKILNSTYIEEQYKHLLIPTNGTYFSYQLNMLNFYFRKHLSELRKPVLRYEWSITPPTVNAFYSPTDNVVVFPAGILQPPFYDSNAPESLNYGAMGVVVGHELTHGFDDQGSQYDLNGNLKNWWRNETFQRFKQKTNCVARQYSKYQVHGLNVNGNLTLGENIADNGGYKLAYKAYQRWRMNNTDFTLPSFNYSNEQLFHIAFAQMWCNEMTPQAARDSILTNVHSPGSIRVLGVFSNSPQFAKAFNCPLGSRMNPEEKCEVW